MFKNNKLYNQKYLKYKMKYLNYKLVRDIVGGGSFTS